MASMWHNFNLPTFATQLILYIKNWLSCVNMCTLYVVAVPRVGTSIVILLHKLLKIKFLVILMFVPWNNTPGYKECVIYFIVFSFVEVITIINWVDNMKPYVSGIL